MKQVEAFMRNPLGIIALFLSVIYGIAQKDGKTYLFEVKRELSLGNFDITLRRLVALQAILENKQYDNLIFILIFISDRKMEEDKMNGLYSKAKLVIPNFEIVNYTVDEIVNR